MRNDPQSPAPTVTGLPDTRTVGLAQLAGEPTAVADSVRHVLPGEEPKQLPVCAFASSI